MRRQEAETVGSIIKRILVENNLDNRLAEQQILDHWIDVVGPSINQHTISRFISKGVLYVKLNSAPLRNELTFHKQRLIVELNRLVAQNIINDIIFK